VWLGTLRVTLRFLTMRLHCVRKGCDGTSFELHSPPEGAENHVVYIICEKCRKLYHLTSTTGQVLRDLTLRQVKEDNNAVIQT